MREDAMKVQDVMTSPAHSCTPAATLKAAARAMCDYGCGALPVLDNAGRPIGILTDRDICMSVARGSQFPGSTVVRDVMTYNPVTCRPGTDLGEVLETMASRRVRRLPVVDGRGSLVGIVSLADVVAAFKDSGGFEPDLLSLLVAASQQTAQPRPWEPKAVPISN
jgi:CBS domain-containing protein